MKVTYTIIDDDPDVEERIGPVKVEWQEENADYIAAECVEYDDAISGDDRGDGESCDVAVFDEGGERELGRFTVTASLLMTYHASPIAKESEAPNADD